MKQIKKEVILVDKSNKQIGTEEVLKAHKQGKLHMAFSILIFNSKRELLLQRRTKSKHHSGGLWSNTCCSHPQPNEKLTDAVHRRLKEEMGFDCKLKKTFCFTYTTKFNNGLIENEYDYVFIGNFNGKPKPAPKEVMDYKYISLEKLKENIKENPDKYTYWLKEILKHEIFR